VLALIDDVLDAIGRTLSIRLDRYSARSVGGGSINESFRVTSPTGEIYFLKLNHSASLDMFQAEEQGLHELAAAQSVRVPVPIVCGQAGDAAFLLMEYLDLTVKSADGAARLGQALAKQHRHVGPNFGWQRNNTIGSTPQPNKWETDWIEFYRSRRLGHQLQLAAEKGYSKNMVETGQLLAERLPAFFESYQPKPSLLHGDLWGGNWGVTVDGDAVIFDPAVYYGDREADIAMTTLFGGFSKEFYVAYNDSWPMDEGYQQRCDLYNLYHVLNHMNLFGSGYAGQAQSMMQKLLAEIR